MHYRGKDARYDLIRPNGARETLLYVPKYDFGWQLVYRFADPIHVEKGSQLIVTCITTTVPTTARIPTPRRRFAGVIKRRRDDDELDRVGRRDAAAGNGICAELKHRLVFSDASSHLRHV